MLYPFFINPLNFSSCLKFTVCHYCCHQIKHFRCHQFPFPLRQCHNNAAKLHTNSWLICHCFLFPLWLPACYCSHYCTMWQQLLPMPLLLQGCSCHPCCYTWYCCLCFAITLVNCCFSFLKMCCCRCPACSAAPSLVSACCPTG